MKKKSIIFSIFTVFAFLFVSCADGIKGSLNDGTSNISTTNTTTSSTTTNPFSGTVWKQSLNGELIPVDGATTITGFDFIIDSTNPNKATISSLEFLKQ